MLCEQLVYLSIRSAFFRQFDSISTRKTQPLLVCGSRLSVVVIDVVIDVLTELCRRIGERALAMAQLRREGAVLDVEWLKLIQVASLGCGCNTHTNAANFFCLRVILLMCGV